MPARQSPRVAGGAAGLGVGVWLIYLCTAGGSLASGDAVAMYEQAKSILDRGALDVPAPFSHPNWQGVDGRHYLAFGLAQAVYDVPFVIVGRALAPFVGVSDGRETVAKAVVALGVTVPCAVSAAFAMLLAWRLSRHRHASVVAGAMLAFGTLMWPYSKYGFNAGLAAAALTAGAYGVGVGVLDRRRVLVASGSFAFGVAMLTRHEFSIAALVALLWIAVETRGRADRWRWLRLAAWGPAVAGALWAWLNWLHFGHPLTTGHVPGLGFGGITGLIVSPSGSVLLYSPVAIASLALIHGVRVDPLCRLLAGLVIAQASFYMLLDDWLGTRSYGPRYLVPLLPLMTAPLALWWPTSAFRRRRWALAALCVISVAVQLPAIPVDVSRVGIAAGQPAAPARRSDWTWSPVLLNLRATATAVPANVRAVASGTRLATTRPDGPLADRLADSLDFWWLYLYHLGAISTWTSLLIALLLFGSGGAIIGVVWRRMGGLGDT